MAIFDYRGSRISVEHGNRYQSQAFVEIDDSTFRYTNKYWTGRGRVEGAKASFRYFGKKMKDLDKGVIKKCEIIINGQGSVEYRGLKWKIKDFINLTTSEFLKKATKGDDKLIGSSKNDFLYGEKGNDRIYGGGGKDLIVGGAGKNKVWGEGGRDTFRVKRGNGYTIIKDFSDGKDRIHLGSGRSGLRLKTRGDDVYVYQRKDLMAIVEDAAGDLKRKSKYLV